MDVNNDSLLQEEQDEINPINDIIDYLVRCANISFKNAHVDEAEIRTNDRVRIANELYERSPTEFLMQYGKYLTSHHINYFEKVLSNNHKHCIEQLKVYHSDTSRRKRIRNRRYKAMQKLESETDYFSEKQMMLRNPLLYEQLVGQYMTDDEIKERDSVDHENLNLLTMILDTVDRNHMTEIKNEQMLEESVETDLNSKERPHSNKMWGEFDVPDTVPKHKPEPRKQTMINAPEKRLLREEFLQEMYSNFIEGRDDFDYSTVDDNEQYDDLNLASQDAEDRYFDSETNEVENLEEHMKLVDEYGRHSSANSNTDEDPLDVFMEHVNKKIQS